MNLTTQNAKNLLNKNPEISKKAAYDILNNADFESFKTLTENEEEIFDFIKSKIVKNFISKTDKNNLKSTFAFAKIYTKSFEDVVLVPWLKFANEDLTDEILELFEHGKEDEKIYCAKYFEKINDPLALEYLNKFAKSNNIELKNACAKALFAFGDNTLRNEYLEILENSKDDFEKFEAANFLINFGDFNDIKKIAETMEDTAFFPNLALDILYNLDLFNIKDKFLKNNLLDAVIGAMPEDLPLDIVFDLNLKEYFENELKNELNSIEERILADFKNLIDLVSENNIYTFDLNKEAKAEIKDLALVFKDFKPDFNKISKELNEDEKRAKKALDTLFQAEKAFENEIIELLNKTKSPILLCEGARYAKEFDFLNKINKADLLEKFTNVNAKALFESYFA